MLSHVPAKSFLKTAVENVVWNILFSHLSDLSKVKWITALEHSLNRGWLVNESGPLCVHP